MMMTMLPLMPWQKDMVKWTVTWAVESPWHTAVVIGLGVVLVAGFVFALMRIPDEPGDLYDDASGSTGK